MHINAIIDWINSAMFTHFTGSVFSLHIIKIFCLDTNQHMATESNIEAVDGNNLSHRWFTDSY